jgi:hypothetical protein
MSETRDSYDEAVEFFTGNQNEIAAAWENPSGHYYGYLFQYMTPDGQTGRRPDGKQCGDPIQVKACDHWVNRHLRVAWTDELTMALRCDEWLPKFFYSMLPHARLAALPAIANAQRMADRMLGRREPNSAERYIGAGI